ncbi:hypothetical protein JTB14_033680 [Gonioctena quinquepunctata]|nr:hypothetical protein JTB14_033680 [Gonioctena quinquepunctata]
MVVGRGFRMLTMTLRNVIKRTVGRGFASSLAKSIEHIDQVQELSLDEKCFLVDEQDKIIGQASKRDCHSVPKNGVIPLHRAFSVFLFNKKGDLLLQKRSAQKLTYPNCYTNSCCSHPIADFPGEEEENNAIGIRKAARRRLNYELGIPLESISIEQIDYITRIHYQDEGERR